MQIKLDELLNNTTYNNGCMEWNGDKNNYGYGQIRIDNKRFVVTRLVILSMGVDIPSNMNVCHKCDNPICINPSHLFLGTQSDNLRDAVNKNRIRKPEHGTMSMYNNHGCRCRLCKDAWNVYIKSRK